MQRHYWKLSLVTPLAPWLLAVVGIRASDGERFNDNTFVNKARSAGLAEVKAAGIAAQRASGAKVKEFAQRVIDDHNRANKDLEALAKRKGWELSSTIDESCQKEIDKISRATTAAGLRPCLHGRASF